MIYLFTGNSEYLIFEAVINWKNQFINKYGDFNLLHIKDFKDIDINFLSENLLSESFLAEKKLIIIDYNNDISSDKEDYIINILDKIPENNILLFSYPNPDKRLKFYKKLEELGQKKEFNSDNQNDLFKHIENKYNGKISAKAINLLIKLKAKNIGKITNEIEKLLITLDFIDENEIKLYIFPEAEESIFEIIDLIFNKELINAITKINLITNEMNVYAFYNNLIANLRTSIYIEKLKDLGESNTNISKILNLGNRSFLVNKTYKLNYIKFEELYINLINIDKKMKTGKIIGSEEKDFLLEIEKVILFSLG